MIGTATEISGSTQMSKPRVTAVSADISLLPVAGSNGPISSTISISSFKPTSIRVAEGFAFAPPLPVAPAPCSRLSVSHCRLWFGSPLNRRLPRLPSRLINRQDKLPEPPICSANDFLAAHKWLIENQIPKTDVKVGLDLTSFSSPAAVLGNVP
jgi:hypothetical protein